ncbi:MAG: methylated-DNA--[protein]-cysteine S-methyltransferase [Fidelibacterota bacterium]|nr:MAG: methylated-DNA--[protein]-cysteine S-methyltransferase [Candidatus Neomarinimicrobiota bacterium]
MLAYDRFSTRIGQLTVVKSDRGVCYIGLPNATLDRVKAWVHKHIPGESLQPAAEPFTRERLELQEYAEGRRNTFSFPVDHRNTPFSLKVLAEVNRIPYGRTATYGNIAERVGHPRAARAVGRAVAANPLSLVIPCHRVVGTNGSLTGYGGGVDLKKQLLQMESGRV